VPLETLVAEGDPTEAMVEASKGANLLVLGVRGRSPFAGLLLGGVSQGAAATAHCPVVLVKVTEQK
jgi:nucleotide-binding universal stress UspA family protein